MIGIIPKLSRAVKTCPFFLLRPSSPLPVRLFSANNNSSGATPVFLQMVNYALSVARSTRSEDSYSQGLLVLEQCQATQCDDYSKHAALLATSTLLSERGMFEEAIEKLRTFQNLEVSPLAVRVAATEALVGLHLEVGNDDSLSMLVDTSLQLLETIQSELSGDSGLKVLESRVKAVIGLVELVLGNVEAADSYLGGSQDCEGRLGNVALSYGELLHGARKFSKAKELYQKVIQSIPENTDFGEPHNLAACNMNSEEVLLAATCALGQLEGHLGNFGVAEEILTTALKKAEDHFGSRHPKVGVVLTCMALLYRGKATMEHSSSLLIQEGLYRRALELLKALPLETEGAKLRSDIVALARGGYAEVLCVQQNRKAEGERMRSWAESAWRNHRLSLAEALELPVSPPKVSVIDSRISRAL